MNTEVNEQVNQEVENQVEEQQVNEQEVQEQEYASKYGWVPQDKYRGDPNDWVDAKTFNEKFVPAIQANRQSHKELREELDRVKRATQESMAILKKTQEEALARKDAEYQQTISTLKSQHREAIRDGNDALADDLEQKIDTLNGDRSKLKNELKKEPEPTEPAPELVSWVDENKWFQEDAELRDYAFYLGNKWDKEGTNPGGKALLDKMTAEVRRMFPHKFDNQNRNRPGAVEGGARPTGSTRGKTSADLPPEHRSMMKDMIAQGLLTEEMYLKEYFSRQ